MPRLKRILLVEDDPDLQQSLADVLREEGYLVDTAGDGKQAIERLFSSDGGALPWLIILDLMLPRFDGWQFADLLKSYARTSRIPLIAISASDKAPPHGVTFLRKPLELEELLGLVHEHSQPLIG